MMTRTEQTAFIKNGFEALYRELETAKPIFLKSCGVPEEMRAEPPDENGWCRWKLIPSPVTAEDLDALEKALGCSLPSLLRTFLSTCCHDFRDAELGRQTPDKPFASVQNSWNPTLIRAGFLPFGWDTEGVFIRCIDLANMPGEDRCPVVQIDHEALADLEENAGRETLLPRMEIVAENFQAFLEEIFSGFLAKKSRALARKYLDGLRETYEDCGEAERWEAFASAVQGVAEEDLAALKALYPELPPSLEALLRFADGTCHRTYPKGRVSFCFLGSDLEEFPYYLLSARQMLDTKDRFAQWGDSLISREFEDVPVDERITRDPAGLRWLHFSDCRNNGGSSQLFIDFSPSETGRAGQIVRYLHDPDELTVIADSFDQYLELLMEQEYDFINEDTLEE